MDSTLNILLIKIYMYSIFNNRYASDKDYKLISATT